MSNLLNILIRNYDTFTDERFIKENKEYFKILFILNGDCINNDYIKSIIKDIDGVEALTTLMLKTKDDIFISPLELETVYLKLIYYCANSLKELWAKSSQLTIV